MHQNVISPSFQANFGINTNILDLILTDNCNRIYTVEHSPPLGGIEHGHHILKYSFSYEKSSHLIKTSKKIKFLYNKGNYNELDLYFKSINWVQEFEGCEVNLCYEKWLKIYESGCEKFIPKLQLDNNNTRNHKCSPWMTKELKRMCKEKKNSWFSNRNSGFKNQVELNKHKKLNKVIKKLVKSNIRDF